MSNKRVKKNNVIIPIIPMLDLTELENLKITGTPDIVTVDFATMFNESYIDPGRNETATRST
jgi:hypothetical protein